MYLVSLDFANAVLASGFPKITVFTCTYLFSLARATCPTHLILVMLVESLNREASIMSFSLSSYYFYCLKPSIPLSTLSSNIPTVHFLLSVGDQVTHPVRTTKL